MEYSSLLFSIEGHLLQTANELFCSLSRLILDATVSGNHDSVAFFSGWFVLCHGDVLRARQVEAGDLARIAVVIFYRVCLQDFRQFRGGEFPAEAGNRILVVTNAARRQWNSQWWIGIFLQEIHHRRVENPVCDS